MEKNHGSAIILVVMLLVIISGLSIAFLSLQQSYNRLQLSKNDYFMNCIISNETEYNYYLENEALHEGVEFIVRENYYILRRTKND